MAHFQYQGGYFALKREKKGEMGNYFTWRSIQLLLNTGFSLDFSTADVTHSKSLPWGVQKIQFMCSNHNYQPHLHMTIPSVWLRN